MSSKTLTVALFVLFLGLPSPAVALTNGDFSNGLDGWTTSGDVIVFDGAAVLGDSTADLSQLFQATPVGSSPSRLEFHFENLLSDALPAGGFGFRDAFFASLYFSDDPAFDPSMGGTSLALFDLDSTGPFNVNGLLGPSERGASWLHFSIVFQTDYAYAIPTFELFNLSGIRGDSEVRIANVSVTPIPEPSAALVFLLGAAVLLYGPSGMRRARR